MPPAPRYRYYTGVVALPTSGAAVVVCKVGPGGCLLESSGGANSAFIGGPDVTAANGFPVNGSPQFVPSTAVMPVAVVPAPAMGDETPLLYACCPAGKPVSLNWMSGHAP